MNPLQRIRSAADQTAKIQRLGGGQQVTADSALQQRAAQQLRMGAMRTKGTVATPESLAAALRKLKVK